MRYDEFIKRVTELGGPADRAEAAEVTQTIIEDLGKRLTGAESSDLAAQLPAELREPLIAQAASAPTADDADDFLRRVASQLGKSVDPEQAQTYVKSVFKTLQETVSEGEIDDIQSQLPAAYRSLFD